MLLLASWSVPGIVPDRGLALEMEMGGWMRETSAQVASARMQRDFKCNYHRDEHVHSNDSVGHLIIAAHTGHRTQHRHKHKADG